MPRLWDRPWAALSTRRSKELVVGGAPVPYGCGACWLFSDASDPVRIRGKQESGTPEPWLGPGIFAVPLPLRPTATLRLVSGRAAFLVDAARLPARPSEDHEPEDEAEQQARMLLNRVKSVWARLREVERSLENPATMWRRLQAIWFEEGAHADPEMDIIVRHARELPRTLDPLERALRRVLRRVRRQVPLDRVQEVDRKSMAWLIRQPGNNIAERAGDGQRIVAVTREQSFNTLENRTIRSYAQMAEAVAREYRDRHGRAGSSPRVERVRRYGERCRRLERDLFALGIAEARPDATPNFVLQNDARYHAVWDAWQELLRRRRILDELWHWQARSWEEFCALVVVIALQSRPGARPVATSRIEFGEEQEDGCWIKHDNPLAVIYLPDARVTVEVTYRQKRGSVLQSFGAPIWLRLGRIDSDAFLQRWAIWPLWNANGGLEPGEGEEIASLLPNGKTEFVKGGITLRPVAEGAEAEDWRGPKSACFTLGAAGAALRDGIDHLGRYLDDVVLRQTV